MTVRSAGWWLMTLLAIGIAAYALAIVALPGIRNGFLIDLFAKSAAAAYAHLVGGAVALAIGPFQLAPRVRHRHLSLHRLLGKVYVVAVMVGGSGSLLLALSASGGLAARTGFGAMGIVWLTSTAMAYLRIRQGRVAEHQVWMIRSYAVTLAAVTLRFYLPLSIASGYSFAAAYPAIAWLCWVPNLIIVEWLLLRGKSA